MNIVKFFAEAVVSKLLLATVLAIRIVTKRCSRTVQKTTLCDVVRIHVAIFYVLCGSGRIVNITVNMF